MKKLPDLPTEKCTGCSACAALCPMEAIAMKADAEGFLRPVIEESKCVGCGKCVALCPVEKGRDAQRQPLSVFAAKAKDVAVQSKSQSGGMFFVLAKDVIEKGGVVYGAALDDTFTTKHIRVDTMEALGRLQGVKYVQSNLDGCFLKVAEDLQAGRAVLFSGTPCQVAGLYQAMTGRKVSTEKLLTVDLVCYGVPSPGVFQKWLQCVEKAFKSPVKQLQYRRLDAPWGKGAEWYLLESGHVLEGSFYTQLYFANLIIRPGCEHCMFCNANRPADLTLGDFWGIEDALLDFLDEKGVSLVMTNTAKGANAFAVLEDMIDFRCSTLAAASKKQPRLRGVAAKPSAYREAFWEKFHGKGMAYIAMERGFIPLTFGFWLSRKWAAFLSRFKK